MKTNIGTVSFKGNIGETPERWTNANRDGSVGTASDS